LSRPWQALIQNDIAALAAVNGNFQAANDQFEQALKIDGGCRQAQANFEFLNQRLLTGDDSTTAADVPDETTVPAQDAPIKVAILSLLFNWPSTGGGNIHTVELARFLMKAGYEVRHYFAQYAPWGIGHKDASCPFPSEAIKFSDSDWNITGIRAAFRHSVESFDPDSVIITDSWNFKPHLSEAVKPFPCLLRMQALECLCPLNNLRMLPDANGGCGQCPCQQLATPNECGACLDRFGRLPGQLHQAERQLSGVGSPEYIQKLYRCVKEAEAVLVLNPSIAELYRPHAKRVEVVTWGMDPSRFPWPPPNVSEDVANSKHGLTTLLFAGLTQEPIKGFHVLREACARLWHRRQDFELVVTSDPPAEKEPFARYVGWHSQKALPQIYRAADICVVPTVVQDGLSRTAVEAMASGRAVIASRIGGLPFAITDGVNGLLCEPNNAFDLEEKIECLLDGPAMRARMGLAGRQEFEKRFTWDGVIERHYRSLLVPKTVAASN
jgi:glycosyltransferase involved in cell wall biosynthesis